MKWWIVLLAGLSWPFLYAIKLGQVGPLLFLLMAIGWRWMDRGPVLGASGALGAAIKIQPGLILAWALLTRRWAAVAERGRGARGAGRCSPPSWPGSGPGRTSSRSSRGSATRSPRRTTSRPGAVAYQLGVSRDAAALLQWVSMALAALAFVVAALRLGGVPSYLVAVIASQLLSPILWDHYALLLLLPVAWLMDRGYWWAAIFVLATPVLVVGQLPPWIYPAAFWATLVAVVAVGVSDRRSTDTGASRPAAA